MFFFIFKDFIASKSLTVREAHNVAYVVYTSHLVILLLKHLIRGHNWLRLSVSRCAQSGLSIESCFLSSPARELSVSTRPSTTQTPCFFS